MVLESHSATELINLGGLKERCSAGLHCEAHGLAIPCDLCDVEGTVGVVCNACGHYFAEGLIRENERPCQSVAEFSRTGKIAFEEVAKAALQAQESEQQCQEQTQRCDALGSDAERERIVTMYLRFGRNRH